MSNCLAQRVARGLAGHGSRELFAAPIAESGDSAILAVSRAFIHQPQRSLSREPHETASAIVPCASCGSSAAARCSAAHPYSVQRALY